MSVPTSLHVCLINLDRSPERLVEFRKINAHMSEDFTRLSAVDGKTLDLGVLQSAGLITSDILTTYSTNELACAMSHIALWKRGLASGEIITIAEDDAIFHQEFQRHATEAIARLPADWDIILWGWNFDLFLSLEMLPGLSPCLAQFEEIKSMEAAPILVIYGAQTPPRSKAEMQGLARFAHVKLVEVPAGKLAVHEEFPEAVAEQILAFADKAMT